MNITDYVTQYTGKITGNTPENTGQCTGLVMVWLALNGNPHIWGDAKDLITNADRNVYSVVLNSAKAFPPPGAVMVWDGTWGNGSGHTGAVVTADTNQFVCFEQNNPTGSKPKLITHTNWNGVIGWIIPKNSLVVNTSPTLSDDQTRAFQVLVDGFKRSDKKTLEDYSRAAVDSYDLVPKLDGDVLSARNQVANLQTDNNQLTSRVAELTSQLITANYNVATLQDKLDEAQVPQVITNTVTKEPVFSSSFANLLYQWAKNLG